MELNTSTVELPDGRLGHLFRASAAQEPLPGVVLVQELWGVDAHIRDVAGRLAAAGYAVLAPDLYSEGGAFPPPLVPERVERVKRFLESVPPQAWGGLGDATGREQVLLGVPAAERGALGETLAAMFPADRSARMQAWSRDLAGAAGFLRQATAVRGRRVGALGFCLGGAVAAGVAAEDPALAAAVVFYGQPPDAGQIARLACPVQGHFGADDARLVAQLPAFEQAMRGAGKALELHVYAGAPHAFFNDTRRSYRPEAAREAWARTLAFLAPLLSPAP
jgi:carboxymethylenebutenolidase